MKVIIKCKKLYEQAVLPIFKYKGDACADLHSCHYVCLHPGERAKIQTGIIMEIPEGWEGQIRPRSGWSDKYGIMVTNSPGSIDAQFRGEICVLLYNSGKEIVHIGQKDRIAQIAIREVPEVEFVEVQELSSTDRGEGGFGSTGVK